MIDIVLPVRNESKILVTNVKQLLDFLKKLNKPIDYQIILAENNSQDNTLEIAKELAKKHHNIRAIHTNKPGRDIALKNCWGNSDADIMVYMDVDLSTDLAHLPDLINAIKEGYDIAIGSRIKFGLKRSFWRKFMSWVYNNLFLPIILSTDVKDAQCGFKAINKKVAKEIVPKLGEENGFLDTELLAVAKHKGYKIKEIPVRWYDSNRKGTMPVGKNIPNFLINMLKTQIKLTRGYYD